MVFESLEFPEVVLRLLAATLLGALLGLNREQKGKPAGLKTLTLVSVGSASFMLVCLELYHSIPDTAEGVSRLDPMRIVQGVIGGIGFLGAGSIIQARGSVMGMTTAATIWVVGAIGLACGLGQYRLAALVTSLAWLILVLLGGIERHWYERGGRTSSSRHPDAP